jgi:DNA-binding CsgD family transcriptional regulator
MPTDAMSEGPRVPAEHAGGPGPPAAAARPEGLWLLASDWTTAARLNGLGRYEDALVVAERAAGHAAGHPDEAGFSTWVLPELVEAAARSGRPDRAAGPLRRLEAIARATGADWPLGAAASARALRAAGTAAEPLYREAIDRLGRTGVRVAQARVHLLYGEWLRRERRRTDARAQLRAAARIFAELEMDGFGERARRELEATGETVRRRGPETLDRLTAQEVQIARMAVDGHTNPQIGAELFLSPRTVEWHLRNVFLKLGVRSRRQLGPALRAAAPEAVPG